MPDTKANDDPDNIEVIVDGDNADPMAPIINGGAGPRREDEIVQERSPPRAREGSTRERDASRRVSDDDGDEEYGERVKRRLAQFRRRVGEAEAARDHLTTENRRLVGELRSASEASFVHYEQAAHARLEAAKREAGDAYDSGDGQRVVEANRKLASAQNAVDSAESIKIRREQEQKREQANPTPEPAAPQPPRYTARTQKWVAENPWFDSDADARAQAIKIHDRLVKDGYEVESDKYFSELSLRSKVLFPEHFEGGDAVEDEEEEAPRRHTAQVASVTRSPSTAARPAGKDRIPVKLSPDQLEAARVSNVTAAQYAAQLHKLRTVGKMK